MDKQWQQRMGRMSNCSAAAALVQNRAGVALDLLPGLGSPHARSGRAVHYDDVGGVVSGIAKVGHAVAGVAYRAFVVLAT